MAGLNDLKREHYDFLVGAKRDFNAQIKFIHNILKRHGVKTVLDCGCGTGTHAIMLAKKGYKITAFDYSRNQIEIAKKKAKKEKVKIDFRTGDIRKFAFGKFDAVISLYSVIMFACKDGSDLDKAMKSIKQSLSPGGIALVETCTPQLVKNSTIKVQKYDSEDLKIARVKFYEKTKTRNLWAVTYTYLTNNKGKALKTTVVRDNNRLFTETEVMSALKKNKLKLINLYGSFIDDKKSYEKYCKDSYFITPLFRKE
jgi:2-polyprenyl-3-methyl-5-hydroxy-6-metoxy-1,4-benzoquinol methylase